MELQDIFSESFLAPETQLLLNQITVPTINQIQFDGSLVTNETAALSFKP